MKNRLVRLVSALWILIIIVSFQAAYAISFDIDTARKVLMVMIINDVATDNYASDGNHRDPNKFHGYQDALNALTVIDDGQWIGYDDGSFHVEYSIVGSKDGSFSVVYQYSGDIIFNGNAYLCKNFNVIYANEKKYLDKSDPWKYGDYRLDADNEFDSYCIVSNQQIEQDSKPVSKDRSVTVELEALLGCGYTLDAAKALVAKAERGEPLTSFHTVDYNVYNMPAEKNGLEGDTILLLGTLEDTIVKKTDKKGEYLVFYFLKQEDGNRWLVFCAAKVDGVLIGENYKKEGTTVFDGLSGKAVEIYGKYMGFSDVYKLPTVDIATYGGMYINDEDLLISTGTAKRMMASDYLYGLNFLIGTTRYWSSFR